jgi:hypothetical protein
MLNVRSSLVCSRYLRLLIKLQYSVEFTAADASTLDNFSLASIGVAHGLQPFILTFSSSLMA